MAVIDEIIVVEKGTSKNIDSADNKTIDLIQYENKDYHFAKPNEVSGKNLFDISKAENGTLASQNGSDLSFEQYPNRCRSGFIYLTAGSYVVSFNELLSTGNYLHKYSSNNQESWLGSLTFTKSGSVSKFALDTNCYIRFTIQPIDTSGSLVLNTETLAKYKPQLESGSERTEYETFSGYENNSRICEDAVNEPIIDMKIQGNSVQDGTPAIESPIEIQSVGDKTKNLFGNYETIENQYIDASGNYVTKEGINTYRYIAVEPNTEYIISGKSDSKGYIRVAEYTKDKTFVKRVYNNVMVNPTITITTTATTKYLALCPDVNFTDGTVTNSHIYDIMIRKSLTTEEYEPYGYKIPIKISGINLADISSGFITQYTGITNEVIGTTLKTTCSVATRGGNLTIGTFPAGIYTVRLKRFSSFKDGLETPQFLTTFVNGKNINLKIYGNEKKKITLTETSSITFYHAFLNSYDYYILEDLMLYAGEEEKEFEPYIEPTTTDIYIKEPLRMINDIADVLDYKNKKVIRNVGSIIFDGNVDWGTYTSGNGYMKTNSIFPDGKPVLCNMFVNSQTLVKTLAIRKNYANIYVYGVQDYYPTPAEWHSFLSENNMEVIGELVTPTEETIEVPEILTLDGTTTFEIVTQLEPSGLSVKYWKQI